MNRYEFLIRFSIVNNKKPTNIRKYLCQIGDDIDAALLLNKLGLNKDQIKQFYQYDISKILGWINQDHHFLITYCDQFYPEHLKQISNAPLLLFGIGDPILLATPQIAMVGSRTFSQYGAKWGRYFARELANSGLTITSGLALGIDAICHRGVLDVAGKTIAVLGSGLLNITPRTNYQLAKEIIINKGTIVSEFLPDKPALPKYFPRRNRIISGLCLGTFVIEASEKSGSLITARYALEQNRDVFALPGDISNPNCDGTNWLIKQGAYLVTRPTDITDHYLSSLTYLKRQSEPKLDNLDLIHPDILAVINNQATPVDIIADKIGLPIDEVAIKLTELELEGLIETVGGGYARK